MGLPAEKHDHEWRTTAEAAAYLRITVRALLAHVARGNIKPDSWGGRGRLKSHRFLVSTLDKFLRGEKAA
jgi:hypothetical protein